MQHCGPFRLNFGGRTQGNGRYQSFFSGALDDIRLFNVEVSAATVSQIYKESSKIMCDGSALGELMDGVNHMCCDGVTPTTWTTLEQDGPNHLVL